MYSIFYREGASLNSLVDTAFQTKIVELMITHVVVSIVMSIQDFNSVEYVETEAFL